MSVQLHFSARWGRDEIHLYWELLDAPFEGTEVWQKLNYYDNAGQASNYFKWYPPLCGQVEQGEQMPPINFEGKAAWITLRGDSKDQYTLVDSAVTPELIPEESDPPPNPMDPSPLTPTHHPHPSPDSHDPPTQTQYPAPSTHTQQLYEEGEIADLSESGTALTADIMLEIEQLPDGRHGIPRASTVRLGIAHGHESVKQAFVENGFVREPGYGHVSTSGGDNA